MFPTVRIVIVNWNTRLQLWNCLQSIIVSDKSGFALERVVVIDNASTDGSLEGLEDLNLPLQVIRNIENRGFAAACNQGAKGSNADYLLFLNPDTLFFKDSLLKTITFMEKEENKNIGIIGVQLIDDDGQTSRTCARFPTLSQYMSKIFGLNYLFPKVFHSHFMLEWDHENSREIDHVMGAFFLVRRFLYEELDGFDERFFVYLEDVDFSIRARQSGWRSYYLSTVKAFHRGGGSSERVKDVRLFYSLRSRIMYSYKHFGFFSATLILLGTILIEPFSRLILAGLHRSAQEVAQTLKAYGLLLRDLPNIMRRSAQQQGRGKDV